MRLLIALLLFATLLSAVASRAADFTSPQGYRVTPPPGWHTAPSTFAWSTKTGNVSTGLMRADVEFAAPPKSHFTANATIMTTEAAPSSEVSAPQVLRMVRDALSARYPRTLSHFRRLAQGQLTVGGAPAMQMVGTYQSGKPPRLTRLRQVYAVQNGKLFIFTLTTLAAGAAPYDAAFSAMLHSVRWTP